MSDDGTSLDDPSLDDPGTTEYRRTVEYRRYHPHTHEGNRIDERQSRNAHGYIRTYFKRRQERYGDYQRWLGKARVGTTYDVYLRRTVLLAGIAAFMGAALVAIVLVSFGRSSSHVDVSRWTEIGLVLLAGLFSGTTVGAGHLYYPRFLARRRGRRIDALLPHAIVFLRTLGQRESDPVALVRELADSEAVYGDVATEFESVEKDVELFGDDLLTALSNADELTPSEMLDSFFDDLVSVIETGGDVGAFLDREVEAQRERTEEKLQELLQTLSVLAVAYVTLLFVGPLLLFVALLIFGLTGANVVPYLSILTYVAIPLGIVGTVVVIDALTRPYRLEVGSRLRRDPDLRERASPTSSASWFEAYRRRQRRDRLYRRLRRPLTTMRRRPLSSLVVTVPLAATVLAFAVFTGVLTPSLEAYANRPIRLTTGFAVVPLLIVCVPLMGFHELKRRREQKIADRFPDSLYTLANVNERGVPLVDGMELVSRRYDGPLAEEFRNVHRDVQLHGDVFRALTDFANRLRLPRVTMTVAVLREVVYSSPDLATPIRSLANDLDMRQSMQRAREREMVTYTLVVTLGILVYLLIVLVLEVAFFPRISEISERSVDVFDGQPSVTVYRTILFHSALIQAFGNGLLLGKLRDDSILSGLKYSNAFLLVVLLAFAIVAPL